MITKDYCGFEIAKLLKEKGFNELCFRLIREDGEIVEAPSQTWNGMTKEEKAQFYLCPTHQMAMAWILEKYNVSIEVSALKRNYWVYTIYKILYNKVKELYNDGEFKSHEKAVEAALKYSLEKLF